MRTGLHHGWWRGRPQSTVGPAKAQFRLGSAGDDRKPKCRCFLQGRVSLRVPGEVGIPGSFRMTQVLLVSLLVLVHSTLPQGPSWLLEHLLPCSSPACGKEEGKKCMSPPFNNTFHMSHVTIPLGPGGQNLVPQL